MLWTNGTFMSVAGICFCAEALPIPTLFKASQVGWLLRVVFVTIGVKILNILDNPTR